MRHSIKRSFLLIFLALCGIYTYAQQMISGAVTDLDDRPIPNVVVTEEGTKNFTYTDIKGEFTLRFSSDKNKLSFEHADYNLVRIPVDSSLLIQVFMAPTILGNNYSLAGKAGYTDFIVKNPNKRLENMPYLLGEADVNRQLQMMAGVEHGSEGFSNLIVRGGNVDENLYLYNDIPVYNYNHLFGISSLFHTNGIADVKLHKGTISSKYGGRLSSVIELETPTSAEFSGLSGEIDISPLSMGLYIRSIKKNESYFTISARRSWMDLLLPIEVRQNDLNANFSDVQVNYGKILANGDKLEISLMRSHDFYLYSLETAPDSGSLQRARYNINFEWGNLASGIKYSQKISKKTRAVHALQFSSFGNALVQKEEILNSSTNLNNPISIYTDKSGIREYIAKTDWTQHRSNTADLIYGSHLNVKTYRTGFVRRQSTDYPNLEDVDETLGQKAFSPSFELSVYGEYIAHISTTTQISLGFRGVGYAYKDLINFYPEPRLHYTQQLDDKSAVKFGYSRHHQFTRLLNVGGTGNPQNFWVPATDQIRPQSSDILEASYERKLGREYSLSSSAYFKRLNNIHLVDNFFAAIDVENDWQQQILQGNGTAYGLEMTFQKNKGILSGWLSYTFSIANRNFEDLSAESFPFDFDRRHMLKMYVNIDAGEFWDFGFNYLIGSGQLFSIPEGKYYDIDGNLQLDYSSFNNFRSPFYHRLDISVLKVKENSYLDQSWKFYIYNAFMRKNALWLNPDFDDASLTNLTVQRVFPTMFAGTSFIPGIAYVVRF